MKPIDIIYQLKLRGISQSQLARDIGVTSGVVNNVINGKITAHAVAQHIAKTLDKEIKDIWPDQYIFVPRKLRRYDKKTKSQPKREEL
jgi:lambda repressor-like predicted transcriptional regulator